MLRVEKRDYEKAVVQIITSTDPRDLIREFSLYRVFFYSLLKDVSRGEDSPNYSIIKKIARDRKINEQFIVDQAKFVLSQLAPDEPEEDYYKILNVPFMASAEEIRESWLNLVKSHHPDNVGDRGLDITKKLNEAYSVLGDPVKRGRYDVRRLPALPIVVSSSWVKIPPKKFAYPFILAVVACILVLYVVKSNYFEPPVEENGLANVEDKGPAKEVDTVKGDKAERSGTSLVQTSSPSSSKSVTKKSPPSGPKAEKMRTASFPTGRQEEVLIAHATAGIEKTPEKEGKGPIQQEPIQQEPIQQEPIQQEPIQQEELSPYKLKPKGGSYVVKRGDSLWEIADRFEVSVRELKDANGLKGNDIGIGQALIIPQAGHKETEEEIKAAEQHVAVSDKSEEPESADKKAQEELQAKAAKPMTFSTDKEPAIKTQEKLQAKAIRPVEPKKSEPVYSQEETASVPHPDEASVYSFVSQYVSAYTNRDITKFMSLFVPDARENGVEISKTRESYIDNFSSLEVIRYSVEIRRVNLKDDTAFTFAVFDLTFRRKGEGEVKNTNGEIVWVLSWRGNQWRIKEINYNIKDVKSLGG